MTSQDMMTIGVLLTMVLIALEFPGGPGTPRRLKQLIPVRESFSA